MKDPPFNTSRPSRAADLRHWLAGAAILALLLLGLWLGRASLRPLMEALADQEVVSATIQHYGLLGPLVLAALQWLQILVPIIPGHAFVVAAGYIYGFFGGVLLNFLSVVTASQFGFLLARWLGRPLVERIVVAETLQRWDELGQRHGFTFFLAAFLLPVFPTDVMNYLAGLSPISGQLFLLANILGRLPTMMMLTLIGSHGLEFPLWVWIVIAITYLSLFGLARLIYRKKRHHP